ncbi:tfiiic subunit sfc7 [Schizosaccharomyces cryophilus OY26]|uniref:Tfiiic subunit sfc7 n=1 Tax=Schizosaccharomyces cryophilus (strain OY26 / ATCC MYA-4695 / CBS 11777 / NBRC 106824 / NRRL Y48691) TaxID=653667 RepID=S9X8T3_SCHCR|nr:tfiiic subunit sfc7 [Schizosaccharomyces cryophilus OY26]EPY50246.1 tfiiic subunit sfc7 [Schizosaccharomyces cryophilus OY26]
MDDLVVMGLDTLHPIVRIGGMFFRGTWFHCIGTDIVVPVRNDIELSKKDLLVCQRRLVLEQIRLVPKKQTEKASQKFNSDAAIEVDQENQTLTSVRIPSGLAQPGSSTTYSVDHDEDMGNVEAASEI